MSPTIGDDLNKDDVAQFDEPAQGVEGMDIDGPETTSRSLKDILLTDTGNGDMSSILNDEATTPLGHILRGVEGFVSELTGQNRGDLAILDVLIGVVKLTLGESQSAGGDIEPTR